MKNSVFKRIFFYTGLLVVALLLLMLVGVRFWLEDYYYARQEDAILSAAEEIQAVYLEDPARVPEALAFYGENLGATMVITTAEGRILFSGTSSNVTMGGMMGGNGRFTRMQGMNGIGEEDWLLYSNSLGDGNLLITRLAYASFERAISVLSWFMLLLTLPLLLIGMFLIFMLSRTISRPLVQLNQVANRMKELDFKARYTGTETDEIGQLGQTLNDLTVRLKDTIGKLQEELKKEKTMESMRKEFVARVSHEIRTPVSVIRGYVEAMEDGLYDDEQEQKVALDVITEESEKITKMTQDLLDLSQLESGNYKLNIKPLDYADLLQDVHKKFLVNKKYDRSLFPIETPNKPVIVMGDGFRLEQVLNNLINNAFAHVEQDGLVRITCYEDKDHIITKIYNKGRKIPEGDLPFLWESFYKGDANSKGNGVGLGLSIAKNILMLHKGSWDVKNLDNGVEFSFVLPKINEE
ncbi:HAMP domain-containing histidine kinase [Alkalibacter rhizosphaerae]|uniref:histidine kinase n=1 Tax=Alkalibacter rhizosphaerae TaxID=2815577 RepID=A0A975AHC7_9FIRM|nr:HAMP domain-containing sensor histidine kinase [Alkalibacter rhizosphaerae]QSX08479.1 HAMP domain-containing histidine kinase [Alkalibacter rhizosphaerae]